MATVRTRTESTQARLFSIGRGELLELLGAQGKLPSAVPANAYVAYDEHDDELTVAWTERSETESTEDR